MSSITPFDFDGNEVRVTTGEDGNVWFVAKDVATALGYTNPQKAVRDHCKGVNDSFTPSAGGDQKVKIIPEPDVYRLVMRSKLPSAERFADWVFEEVLPSIRRTGTYTRDENAPIDPFMASINAMEELDRAMQVFSVSQGDKVKLLHLSMKAQGLGVDHVSSNLMDAVLESPVASWTRIRIREDIREAVADAGELQFHELLDACEVDDDGQQFNDYCDEIESMIAAGILRASTSLRPVPGTDGQVSVYTL